MATRPRRSAQAKSAIAARGRPSKSRSVRKKVTYTEPASDPEEDSSVDELESEQPSPPRRDRSAAPPSLPSHPKKRKATTQGKGRGRPKMPRVGAPLKAKKEKTTPKKRPYDIKFTGKKMPWQTLPYHILELIFDYASHPLYDNDYQPQPSALWLTQVARLCKGFAEPALSALYASPPLDPPARVRHLIERLEGQNVASFMNYKAKIKSIHLEAVTILGRKSDGLDPVDLCKLFALTPQLRDAGLHLHIDNSRCQNGFQTRFIGKTSYPTRMIESMENAQIKLQAWTWNSLLATPEAFRLLHLREVHQSKVFQSLRSLTFIHYENSRGRPQDGTSQPADVYLDKCLEVLPNLQSLIFKKSPLLEHVLSSAIPSGLRHLEISECDIDASQAEDFFRFKGGELRHLVLDHNRYLNLSWLNDLATSCPKLEVLEMDMIYYSPYATVTDTDPQYRFLLSPQDAPTWPTTLRCINLCHLRKWETGVANKFFWTLVKAAPSLDDLRELVVKASLDESGWRDRIAFRDGWIQRLNHVFLRKSAPPNPHLKTFAAWREHKSRKGKPLPIKPGAKIQHVESPVKKVDDPEENASDSDKPLALTRRSRRSKVALDYNEDALAPSTPKRPRRRRRRNTGASSGEDSAIEDAPIPASNRRAAKQTEEDSELFVQGMCDVVDIMIDNLRPTEEQLHESDFLDEEISGDEDWNGDDDGVEEDGYAW